MCTYINWKTGDEFDWMIGSGGTPSVYTGPKIDHTTGTKDGKKTGFSFLFPFTKTVIKLPDLTYQCMSCCMYKIVSNLKVINYFHILLSLKRIREQAGGKHSPNQGFTFYNSQPHKYLFKELNVMDMFFLFRYQAINTKQLFTIQYWSIQNLRTERKIVNIMKQDNRYNLTGCV